MDSQAPARERPRSGSERALLALGIAGLIGSLCSIYWLGNGTSPRLPRPALDAEPATAAETALSVDEVAALLAAQSRDPTAVAFARSYMDDAALKDLWLDYERNHGDLDRLLGSLAETQGFPRLIERFRQDPGFARLVARLLAEPRVARHALRLKRQALSPRNDETGAFMRSLEAAVYKGTQR